MTPSPTSVLSWVLFVWLGAFAGWTAASVPLTFAGAPFSALWLAAGAAVIGAALGARHGAWPGVETASGTHSYSLEYPGLRRSLPSLAGVAVFIASAAYFVKAANAAPLWLATVILALSVLVSTRQPVPASRPEAPVANEMAASFWSVGLLALGIIALYFILHRPDADDAFYLNLVMGLVSSEKGMMVEDTMYGMPNWPILGSNYRVEALPTLAAAISWATGLPAVDVAHLVLPILWSVGWALALTVIGYSFFGRRWPVFAILSVLTTLVFAGTLQTWGTHGIARLFHGKAPLLLIIVPLIVHIVMLTRQDRIPIWSAWVVLSILQIAAVGLTANAIYIAPIALGLALAAAFLVRPRFGKSLILLTPSVFPLMAGLWILFFDTPVVAGMGKAVEDLSLWDMANTKATLSMLLITILAATLAGRFVPGARILTGFVLAAAILVVNPVMWLFFENHVTGGLSFRVWWALPVPMLLAMLLTWASGLAPRPILGSIVAVAGLAVMAISPSGLIGMEGTGLKLSIHKIPPEAEIARQVVDLGGTVTTLAPEAIAAWMPTLEMRPPLVFSRNLYLFHSAQVMPQEAMAPRSLLADWIDGRSLPPIEEVKEALALLCVQTLVLPEGRSADLAGAKMLGSIDAYRVYQLEGCPT